MKICIINGSPRSNGNTKRAVEVVKDRLSEHGNVEFIEFNLNKDFTSFCKGCYTCIYRDEKKCPNIKDFSPIMDAIEECDGLIISSPVYVMNMSGVMKNFLDHFGWQFMLHRPIESMFSKHAMIISTTAGSGTKHVSKSIKRVLNYIGIRSTISVGTTLYSEKFEGMNDKRKAKALKELTSSADKFYTRVTRGKNTFAQPFTRGMFFVSKQIVKSKDENDIDKIYWRENGWLNGKKPY